MRSDQTEMQNQAASLILFRDFASTAADPTSSSVSVVANTISEWLSNQVSYYLTGFVSELVNNVGFIDDIEFDVGYRLPSGEYATAGTVSRSEVGISTKVIMFDRTVEASLKGDFINGSEASGANSSYFNTDLIFDFILTKDRRWRLRAYVKQDQYFTDRRTKGGLGIAWRREYDNLAEYRAALKKASEARKSSRIK